MPRYEWNPSAVSTTIEVFPKGDYEVTVGEPKAFARQNQQGKDTYGIRYPLTLADNGKRTVFTVYMHSEGAQSFGKMFLMAALGFEKSPEAEKEFDAQMAEQDWNYDPETGGVGDGWRLAMGQRAIVSLDIQISKEDDKERQNFVGFRRLESD